uniref:NADH-ubiquinone oxidoreductase chain 6 n=1 Tax=Hemitheconyx caudicinctus TaxID=96741 RepID=I7H0A6_9SAUR|nr:NADH dehydrogenase subunit 6 [Hemitheconyx caudicinctus]BAM34431.1 NADH dehydrogenase subunit 6 [Hemitheconyx caudicinctus]
MSYFLLFCFLFSVIGVLGASSNPSPVLGVVGLVVGSLFACVLLVGLGSSFVSVILFLIYMGGMMVVFAYSLVVSAENYLEGWTEMHVLGYFLVYVVLAVGVWAAGGEEVSVVDVVSGGLHSVRVDFEGVKLLYSWGGPVLIVCGCGLLLMTIIVPELVSVVKWGAVRLK